MEQQVAPAWSEAFPDAAVASYLEPKSTLLVVVAGAAESGSADATAALVKALRASGRTALVMTAESLGDVTAFADDADRREGQGPSRRTGEHRPRLPRCRGSASDGGGDALHAKGRRAGVRVVGVPAAPLVAKETGATGSDGVQAKAVEEVAAVAKAIVKAEAGSQEEYDQKYIGYDDFQSVNGYGQLRGRSRRSSDRGKFKQPLEPPEAFDPGRAQRPAREAATSSMGTQATDA